MSADNSLPHELKKDSKRTTLLIAGGLTLLTIALVGVTWYCVTGLQDNSVKMRKFKVKDAVESAPHAYGKLIFLDRDERPDEQLPHLVSHNLWMKGKKLLEQKQYAAALLEFEKSISELSSDIAKGHKDPDDPRMFAMRYSNLADCYMPLDQPEKAADALTRAIKILPKRMYYKRRSLAYRAMGEAKLARMDQRKVKALKNAEPDDPRRAAVADFLHEEERVSSPEFQDRKKRNRKARRAARGQ